jgi:hypothetical protein
VTQRKREDRRWQPSPRRCRQTSSLTRSRK